MPNYKNCSRCGNINKGVSTVKMLFNTDNFNFNLCIKCKRLYKDQIIKN